MTALRALLLMLFASQLAAAQGGGTLVIAGGGLRADNTDVYRAFLDARPPGAPGILIVAAASGEPALSAASAAAALRTHGAVAADLMFAEVAVVDDPSTAADESRWADGADRVPDLAKVGAIWFTGGDQSRIARAFLRPDGSDRPLLAALRARLRAGAVIGGTSAGAAMMTNPMIASGIAAPAAAVRMLGVGESGGDGDAVTLAPGLGFLTHALTDQHFAERKRIGRLLLALNYLPAPQRLGLGVDEDTALIISLASGEARVVGRGTVWRVEARGPEPAIRRYRSGETFTLLPAGTPHGR